jgi:hypothetical protein
MNKRCIAALLASSIGLALSPSAHAYWSYAYSTNAYSYAGAKYPGIDPCAHKTGDCSSGLDMNWAYAPDGANEKPYKTPTLLLFLPGHGASVSGYTDFLEAAVKEGYYVVGLAYQNGQTVQGLCGYWADCPGMLFQQNVEHDVDNDFYTTLTQPPYSYPTTSNSVNYRLAAFLDYLQSQRVSGDTTNWKQFYDYPTHNVNWSHIVIAGHSEGGATAAWIVKEKPVIGGITFEAPYSTLDNAAGGPPDVNTINYSNPADSIIYTPCSDSECFGSTTHPAGNNELFANYLQNDPSTNWVDRLWITLDWWDKGYDDSTTPAQCDTATGDTGICSGATCSAGQCTIPIWPGLNMRGAALALGKHESFIPVGSYPQGGLGGHRWWTSQTAPSGSCTGHDGTVVNGCYPAGMQTYWQMVLDDALTSQP